MSREGDVKVHLIYKFIGAIYKAIYKEIGDDAWDILWKSGEILFDSIKDEIGIRKDMGVHEALNKLSQFLREIHIVDDITYIINSKDNVIEYEITFRIPLRYERREEAGPIYIFSSLFVALMKYLGYEVSKEAEPRISEYNRLVERWKFAKKS
jgi:hypothetical protein